MNWLNGNIIWVVVAIAAVWFFMARGRGRGHGMGGHHHGSQADRGDAAERPPELGHGNAPHTETAAALDPVSGGNPVRTDRALTAVFGGRAYYFESEDTRKRFEAEPQRYATAEPPPEHRPRRRGGC